AASLVAARLGCAGGVGLERQQDWEDPALPASPFGSDPAIASIGFTNGKPAGSADPLTWAQASEARLIQDLGSGRIIEQPQVVRDRYVQRPAPPAAAVTLTAPASGSEVNAASVTVVGTTTPGAAVDVASSPVEIAGA